MRDIGFHAVRIAGFGLTSPDADRLREFYVTTFGARHVSSEQIAGARCERELGVPGGALRHTLQVGHEVVDILQFERPGRPYPRPLCPDDTAFQHFALVVSDMDLAMAQLRGAADWSPISIGGPQHLPQRSGGVTAYKFRDPDGHPLELLAFPRHAIAPRWKEHSAHGIFQGIDHSAISVQNTTVSTAFYASLGFTVATEFRSHGEAQANLDGVPSPQVEITALFLDASTPHLELLCYRSAARPTRQEWASNDVAATRINLAAGERGNDIDAVQRLIVDPDGHHLRLVF